MTREVEDCISRAYIEPIIEELENICVNGELKEIWRESEDKNDKSNQHRC